MSSVDAAFWFAETPSWHMHIGALAICDPRQVPGFSVESVRRIVGERLPELPQLRYRVAEAPFGLDRPWYVDEDPDLEYHIRHIAVPSRADGQNSTNSSHGCGPYKLDRDKPLWEMWFIEGLDEGRVALLTKVHQSLVDGVSGAGITEILFDPTPDPRPPAESAAPRARSRPPRPEVRLLSAAANLALVTPYRIVRLVDQTVRQWLAVRSLPEKAPGYFEAPPSRFNAPISQQRRFSAARVSLDRVKAVKDAYGVKVNDVVLATVAGALRSYLERTGELPARPLVAQVPVSTRTNATGPVPPSVR